MPENLECLLLRIHRPHMSQIKTAQLQTLVDRLRLLSANQDHFIHPALHFCTEGTVQLLLARAEFDHSRRHDQHRSDWH